MGATYLSIETKTASGTITVPENCDYMAALVTGSLLPPIVNARTMETVATVAATGANPAISLHVMPIDVIYEYEFVMYGTSCTFVYIQNGICVRPGTVYGYSSSGTVAGTLATSTNDLIVGVVVGNNGQVTITNDTVALTYAVDSLTSRIGYATPGDAVGTIAASDPGTVTGYWYTPDAVWVNTSTSVLISEGYYEFVPTLHTRAYWYARTEYGYDFYLIVVDGVSTGSYKAVVTGSTVPATVTWYTYEAVWHDPVYEVQPSGYWSYPDPVWVETGEDGQVSAIITSIADTMIGGMYISRPLVA